MSTRSRHHPLRLAVRQRRGTRRRTRPGRSWPTRLVGEVGVRGRERRVELAHLGPGVGVGGDQPDLDLRDARRAAGAARLRCTPIPRRRLLDTPCRILYRHLHTYAMRTPEVPTACGERRRAGEARGSWSNTSSSKAGQRAAGPPLLPDGERHPGRRPWPRRRRRQGTGRGRRRGRCGGRSRAPARARDPREPSRVADRERRVPAHEAAPRRSTRRDRTAGGRRWRASPPATRRAAARRAGAPRAARPGATCSPTRCRGSRLPSIAK